MPRDRAPRGGKPAGSRPSRFGGESSAGGARPGKPGFGEGRPARAPRTGEGKPAFGEGRPARGAKPAFGEGKPARGKSAFGEGRPARGAKPAFEGERPGRAKPAYEGERPSRAKPAYDGERPSRAKPAFDGERPSRAGKPAYEGDKPTRAPRGAKADARPPRAPRPARDDDRAPSGGQREVSFDSAGRRDRTEVQDERNDIVFGRHPALAALEGEGTVNKVWVLNGLRNQELIAKVRQLAKEKGATVQMVERPKLDALTNDANHQGIVVSLAMAAYVEIEEAIEKAKATKYPSLLLLDGIEDPHNLGALIRSAEGAGFAGVVIASRRAVGLTPVVAKASAGAIARVPVARVGNLAQAAKTLKDAGFWLVGADAHGEKTPYEVDFAQPLVLVIGGEGKGLGRLLAEKCDYLVKLPLGGELESLNASVAGGVLMYEAVRQRWAKDRQG